MLGGPKCAELNVKIILGVNPKHEKLRRQRPEARRRAGQSQPQIQQSQIETLKFSLKIL